MHRPDPASWQNLHASDSFLLVRTALRPIEPAREALFSGAIRVTHDGATPALARRMARPLRIDVAGLTYHVWARGTGRMTIYLDDRDREQFLALLARAFRSHRVDCHAYCLMNNHYHLVISTNESNLSRALHQLNSPYAQWWNGRHSRPGHVFQGRFGCQVVQQEGYLLTACRYVVLNPVRAGLVTSPEQWPWSSYRATAGLEPVPPFLYPHTLWQILGDDESDDTRRRYRAFVQPSASSAPSLPRDPVVGEEAFVRRFEDRRRRASIEVPRRDRRTRPPLTGFFANALTPADRAAAARAARDSGYAVVEIARTLGVHYSTVSRMIPRAKLR